MHHLPRAWPRSILAGLVVLGSAVAAPAAAAAQEEHTTHEGFVYVDDNTTGTNTVAAFVRGTDGRLTPVPGSPFNAGGAGTGSGLASQGAVQISSDGRYVIAVDAGSNQISVLRIEHDGALQPVPGGPVASGGSLPVSLAEHDGLVYVANSGPGGTNYTGFTLSEGGRLRPLSGSTVSLPDTAQPGDLLFNPTATHLVGTRVGTSQIDSFDVNPDGRLTAAPGSPFPAIRQRVPPEQSQSAVCLQRARRRREWNRVRVSCRPNRHAFLDRRLTVRGRTNGAVLGRDQP